MSKESKEFLYRVYDPQFMCYISNRSNRSTWLVRRHADELCDERNYYRQGTRRPYFEVHTFKLVRVEESSDDS